MSTYGQFCPVAMASEVLTERWTPLVLRELLSGSTRFNDLRRGVPLMSPTLLAKRLRTLERVGVVERNGPEYVLTAAGEELGPVVEALGLWGQRWARSDLEAKHFDASLLMWEVRRSIVVERLPDRRVVVLFRLAGSIDAKSRFWLVVSPGEVDLCLADPGHEVDVIVTGHVRTMIEYWMGDVEFVDAVRSGALSVDGPASLVRALPTWFARSRFAGVSSAR
jgi:DNA-binding HxlR family transcriptional regulator